MILTNDLSKTFGDFLAVDGLTVDVQPGHILALLGQNGAGKTTTVRMLTSLLTPTRGWARVAGFDVVREPEKVRSSVGVLTEQHGLYLRMSGEEYLDFFGKIYGLDLLQRHKRCANLLENFGLREAAHQPIGQYSKGMRQKLALARTLLHEPPVLLLDEPTSAMDPEAASLVRNAIASLRSANRTIVICTHNLIEAELLADQIAIIYRGRILVQGTMDTLRKSLLGPIEYELRINGGWQDKRVELPAGATLIRKHEFGAFFRIENPEKTNPILLNRLFSSGLEIIAMQETPKTLEDIYLTAMAKVNHV